MTLRVPVLLALLVCVPSPGAGQQAAGTSRIRDTLLGAAARPGDPRPPASGYLHIVWPAYVAADGVTTVPGGAWDVRLLAGGLLLVDLVPYPAYVVSYYLDGLPVYSEYWSVPASTPPAVLSLVDVRTSTLAPPTVAGLRGLAGPSGAAGATGAAGASGAAGPIGSTGPAGSAGPAGATGATGPAGTAGPAGATGATGPAGAAGTTGLTGSTGASGPSGAAGATGAAGPAGATGASGPNGATGAAGAAGGSAFPSSAVSGIVAAAGNTYLIADGASYCDTSAGGGSLRYAVYYDGSAWRCFARSAFQVSRIASGSLTNVAASSTSYVALAGGLGSGVSEANNQISLPFAVVATQIHIVTAGTQPGTGALTCALRFSSTNQALSLAVPAGGTAGSYSDASNASHYTLIPAGIPFSAACSNAATATSTSFIQMDLAYFSAN